MSELSDEASESEQFGLSLSVWLADSGGSREELDLPLDLHTACSIGQFDVVAEWIRRYGCLTFLFVDLLTHFNSLAIH